MAVETEAEPRTRGEASVPEAELEHPRTEVKPEGWRSLTEPKGWRDE